MLEAIIKSADKELQEGYLWETKNIIREAKKKYEYQTYSKRYETNIYAGTNSKLRAKKYMEENKEYKILTQINNKKGYRQFIAFKNWNDCWEKYQHEKYTNRYLYELILSEKESKPYLDIEWYTYENIDKEILNTMKEDIKKIYEENYEIKLEEKDFKITCASNKDKMSYHIVLNIKRGNNYYVYKTNRSLDDESESNAYNLYEELLKQNETYKKIIDKSVYSQDREFRVIYSTKYGDIRQLIPIEDKNKPRKNGYFIENWQDYMVTHFDEGSEFVYIKTQKKIRNIINTPIGPDGKQIKIDKKKLSIKDYKDVKIKINNLYDEDEKLTRIYELASVIHPTMQYKGNTNNGLGYRFTYIDRDEECYTGNKHVTQEFCVFVNNENGEIYMYCYSVRCEKLYYLGKMYKESEWRNQAIHINQQYLKHIKEITINDNYKQEELIVSREVSKLFNNNEISKSSNDDEINKPNILAITSTMGSGKTSLLKSILKYNAKEMRILYLSHRQTFTQSVFSFLGEHGFKNYMDTDYKYDLYKYDKVIVQLDSLTRLVNMNNSEISQYDMIIMDEIESLLSHLSSKTIGEKRRSITLILEDILMNSKYILALDADYNDRSNEFLKLINPEVRIIVNHYKPKTRRFVFNSNYELRIHQIFEDIKNNQNIVITTLSKNIADEIYNNIKQNFKDVKIMLYSSMTGDKDKKELDNVATIWKQYQVLIYTPTISAGVDFSEDHFNRMYALICSGSCTPRDFIQMTGRIRKLGDQNIRCHIDKTIFNKKTNIYIPELKEFENYLKTDFKNYNDTIVNKNKKGNNLFTIKPNIFMRTYAFNKLENYLSKSNFMKILKETIINKGHTYIYETKGESETLPIENIENNQNEVIINECEGSINVSEHHSEETKSNELNDNNIQNIENQIENCLNEQSIQSTSKKSTYEMDELIACEPINENLIKEIEIKKMSRLATHQEKVYYKKYIMMTLFKLNETEFNLEFVLNWNNKEEIFNNLLHYKKIIPYPEKDKDILNNVKERCEYVDRILKIYGFKDLLDYDTIIKDDEELTKKIKDSKILDERDNIRKLLEKTLYNYTECKPHEKLTIKLNKIANMIFNNFGINIISSYSRPRINGKQVRLYEYKLENGKHNAKEFILRYMN